MPQEWEQGNAAREFSYDESANPYKPLNYAERLQNAGRKPPSTPSGSYAPGQLYGRSRAETHREPAVQAAPSAPPSAAPQMELPSYLQHPPRRAERTANVSAPDVHTPVEQAKPGTLYSAALFAHQPTAVMPSGYDDTPFASRPTEDFNPFFEEPPAPQQPVFAPEEPREEFYFEEELQPRPWRDPFTPAAPKEEPAHPADHPSKHGKQAAPRPRTEPKRRPVRLARVAALIAAAAMLLFCGIVGGTMILELSRNESDMEAARSEYRERTGQELRHGAARVDLLPAGQTFVPTATPEPTRYQPTPSPTPAIPINEAAVISLNKRDVSQVQEAQQTEPTPKPRTKLNAYPDNPLNNVHPSLTELVKENGDVVGRLVIDGVIDELVMHRNNTYYLTHNSLGLSNQAGAVFMDESCSLRFPPENLLLRGQCIVPGRTFNPLLQYAMGGTAFVSTAATAKLTTLYEEASYVLFAVIVASSDPGSASYFNYASHPTFATDTAMMAYVESAKQHSLYQFNVDVQPSDRLLTLSTMGGTDTLVLLYRMAREGEHF